MVNWRRFRPGDFEYDFERDKLAEHGVAFEEAVECFFSGFDHRMADMKTRKSSKRRRLTDEEVDHIVISQAETEGAWEAPIEVRKARRGSFSIPPDWKRLPSPL